MPKRPENWATRSYYDPNRAASEWPDVPEDLLVFLEEIYRPACYDPDHVTLERHLQYGGAVALVASMRAAHERQKKEAADPGEESEISTTPADTILELQGD